MLTQQEIDRMWLEAQLEIDDLFDEFYREALGPRAELLAAMQQREQAQSMEQMNQEDEMLMQGMGGMEGMQGMGGMPGMEGLEGGVP